MKVPYNYLTEEFKLNPRFPGDLQDGLAGKIFDELMHEVPKGEFTLGPAVAEFEKMWAATVGSKYAIGVNSGTDALFLSMKALGIGRGDKIATVPNTFMATVGAILATGAEPYFVDIDDRHLMDEVCSIPRDVQYALPVHWAGAVSNIRDGAFFRIVIEDAAQAIGGINKDGKNAGTIGDIAAFSLHPLKNVNVWGDGGMITTSDEGLADEVRLLRNHGLQGRDIWLKPGYNSRLHTIQAIVGKHVLVEEFELGTEARRYNAKIYDDAFSEMPQIKVPPREGRHVFHLYQVEVGDYATRQLLIDYLNRNDIEAKVHYPIPLHHQPAIQEMSSFINWNTSFPRAERFAETHITLPVHQYLSQDQIEFTVETIAEFFKQNPGAPNA